jgi:hypothetical protein
MRVAAAGTTKYPKMASVLGRRGRPLVRSVRVSPSASMSGIQWKSTLIVDARRKSEPNPKTAALKGSS